jgi:hypothetical protein
MRKVKLVLDDLQVESFAVEPETAGSRGTVEGHVEESGVHTNCFTHCATKCEGSCTCPSEAASHCAGDSCDGCETWWTNDWWECGGGTEA